MLVQHNVFHKLIFLLYFVVLDLSIAYDRSSGIVFVEIDGTNGTICNDGMTNKEAVVICRELGYRFVKYILNTENSLEC